MDAGTLKLEPIAQELLSPLVAGVVGGPLPVKLMAVRGMAPLPPADLLVAIYQLSFDADPAARSAAEAAPAALPDKIILGSLGEALPPQVLHFYAERLPKERHQALEKILYNRVTADATFVHLARKLDEAGLEIILQNEVRLLRSTALVEALYFNKNARMSSVTRALELCARNHVRPGGIPGFDEMAAAILADPHSAASSTSDETFAAALREDEGGPAGQGSPAGPPNESPPLAPPGARPSAARPSVPGAGDHAALADGPDPKRQAGSTTFMKLEGLKIFEKVRLATVGNARCRQVLIRDTNRLVAMAVIRSPSITDMEVVAAASNRAVCDEVIRYIANSREHVKDYAVKQALVNNPKCPLAASLRLLGFLRPDDLKTLARSKNVPGAVATAAKKLLQARESSRGG
jgi:hypothetical protein